MSKSWRSFFGIVVFLVIVIIAITFLSYRLLTKSLAYTSGALNLNFLDRPVKVYRDEYGIPHIFAQNEQDLFRAAGFITAQDRLWQMDFNRRMANGRLSEIFGQSSLRSDRFLRTWGFARTAREIVKILSPESRLALEAYVEGVNAFIETHLDRLPIEFALLRYKPELWKIEDSLAFVRLMAWKLSFDWYVEPVLSQLVDKLGENLAREVFPGFPKQGPFIISAETKPFWTATQQFINTGLEVRNFLGIQGSQLGSNSWVVSGEKSTCGKPLLANDPHLEITAPSVWYEIHLSGGDINVAGVSLPGIPGVVIGHNQKIAWGLTNGMVDDVDFYIEKMNPDNPVQYSYQGKWEDVGVIEEEIVVKDSDPVPLQIHFTRNGTMITNLHPVLKNSETAISFRWIGHQPSDELTAYLRILKAKNWFDFKEALKNFMVPAQNFIFASSDGDIGYYLGGAIPIRKNATGILPHHGWLERGQWLGEVPFEKRPHVFNPPANFIVTANNKIVDDRYPFYITNLWEPPSRAARIHQLLSEKNKFSLNDFKNMQIDQISVHAQNILPILLNSVKNKLQVKPDKPLKMLYDLIKNWDCQESTESVATSLFHAFFVKLAENTLKDEMGESLYKNYIRVGNVPFRVMASLLENEDSNWFDNVTTISVETRDDVIVQSLLDAGDLLKSMAGETLSDWTWGKIHTLTMHHPLGKKNHLDVLFNLGPFPRGGSKTTINNAEYRFSRPFSAVLGASTRQLVDLCNLKRALSVITSGQSGQRMSAHYKDQTPLWLDGQYHEMNMDSTKIAQTAVKLLILNP